MCNLDPLISEPSDLELETGTILVLFQILIYMSSRCPPFFSGRADFRETPRGEVRFIKTFFFNLGVFTAMVSGIHRGSNQPYSAGLTALKSSKFDGVTD